MPHTALQLYTVRELLPGRYREVVRQVADMGYAGVEPAGGYDIGVEAAAALFSELGLAVPSFHGPMPVGADRDPAIETAGLLGAQRTAVEPPFEPYNTDLGRATLADSVRPGQFDGILCRL